MARKYHDHVVAPVLEVVKAWIDPAVKKPRTIHHLGHGNFMVGGETIKLKSKMK